MTKGKRKKRLAVLVSLQLTMPWSVCLGQDFFVVCCLSLAVAAAVVASGVTAFVTVTVTLLMLLLVIVLSASAFQYVGLELVHV